ncbi:MAG TPA: DASS family sodium-coupled anion symporter [Longimicrobiales bacterium]
MSTVGTEPKPAPGAAGAAATPSETPREAAAGWRGGPGLWLGAGAFLLILLLPTPAGLSPEGQRVAAVAALMATWWMTEAIPLPATSLLPIALFPALGVMSAGEATAPYANHVIFLYLGGFLIALAMQRWGLHRRIALGVVALVGTAPRRLVLGFMLATGFVSAWMSNTATVVMMLPIALAILALLEEDGTGPLGAALMLGVGYAASIGGVATLVGTPPNAIFAAAAEEILGRDIGFVEWMYVGVPFALVMLFASWFVLARVLFRLPAGTAADAAARAMVREQRAALGRMRAGERVVAIVFLATAAAWIMGGPKTIAGVTIPGIATFLPRVADSTIAIVGALALFLIPVATDDGRRVPVLDWDTAVQVPWGVLLLFGGGLSLARGFEISGLSAWIGGSVGYLSTLPDVGIIAAVVTLFTFLTELTSNTATATMGMPILAGIAAGVGADPLTLMAAAALASSMAFMLPAATPPNAIVFGTGRVTIRQMVRAGIWLNGIAIVLVTLTVYFGIIGVFGTEG